MNLLQPAPAEIAVERRLYCHVCGTVGRETDHQFRDRLHDVPGEWKLRTCRDPQCGLFWLDPMPCPAEISRLYPRGYFTHAPQQRPSAPTSACAGELPTRRVAQVRSGWRNGCVPATGPAIRAGVWERLGGQVSRLCRLLPGAIHPASRHPEFWIRCPAPSAKLLDVGCGDGEFLARMRQFGWDVQGVEPDQAAVQAARATHNVPVGHGTLETWREDAAAFDAVTLLHVIEHVPDPRETLRAAWRLLRPGGRLLVVTPNARSLGTRVFGRDWVGWDPPRHLHVFTSAALHRLLSATGFSLELMNSTGRNARWTWDASTEIRRTGRCQRVNEPQGTVASRWGGRLARFVENLLPVRCPLGEELVAVCIKSPDGPRAPCRRSSSR